MSITNEKDWNQLDFTSWEVIQDHIYAEPGWDLENFLPTKVLRPAGAMVGHAWISDQDEYIEHWILQDGDDTYYRYRADDTVSCSSCDDVIPAHSGGQRYDTLEVALAGHA
jgi:hypothetical protein